MFRGEVFRRALSRSPILLTAAAVAVVLVVVIGRNGVLITPDSVVYKGVSENLRAGRGLTVPFSTFTNSLDPTTAWELRGAVPYTDQAPLYPVLLAALGGLGLSFDTANLGLNVLLLAGLVVLTGLLAERLMNSRAASVGSALIVLVLFIGPMDFERNPFALLFASALSEPLMLVLVLASLSSLAQFFSTGHQKWLIVATLLSGLTVLSRFSGLSMILTLGLGIMILGPGDRRSRLFRAIVAPVAAAVPAVSILVVNQRRLGGRTRPPGLRAPLEVPGELVRSLSGLLWPWSAPVGATLAAGIGVLILVVGALVWAAVLDHRAEGGQVAPAEVAPAEVATRNLLAMFCLCYVLVLVGSRLMLDSTLHADGRLLAPMLIPAALLLVRAAAHARAGTQLGLRVAAIAALTVVLCFSGIPSVVRSVGNGLLPASDGPSELERRLETLPPTPVVFSNFPDSVWLHSSRPAAMVPCGIDWFTGEKNDAYAEQIRELVDLVDSGKALIVVGPPSPSHSSCLGRDEAAQLGLKEIRSWPDSDAYGASGRG